MIAVVNYGAGNIRSVSKALERAGAEVMVTSEAGEILKAGKIVLPGVCSVQQDDTPSAQKILPQRPSCGTRIATSPR